jgi:hypothetical protein
MAESNGNGPAILEEPEAATAGLVEDLPTTTEVAEAAEEPIRVSKGIYFVRVPRPHFDDTTIKNLQQELTNQIGKLKAINGKMQIKRVRHFRGAGLQMLCIVCDTNHVLFACRVRRTY